MRCLCKGWLVAVVVLALLLVASVGGHVYLYYWGWDSYLQDPDEIYIMESGILLGYEAFAEGEEHTFTYDFAHEDYAKLVAQYAIDVTAGEGSEWERAARLMNEYAPRLRHQSNYDNHVEMAAIPLLAYSLDNRQQGINCRSKAQILNEMCLALGIHARKVWIMPNSAYDTDCHVVNEVWDSTLEKWVMLDMTNNEYWVDENGTPLSVLEIRQRGAEQAFCTPVCPGDALEDLESLKKRSIGDFLYIMKNMVYMQYCAGYTVGEVRPIYTLLPQGYSADHHLLISQQACEAPPADFQ